MKIPRIANAMGYIDDELVTDAAGRKKKNKNLWLKWGFVAACFAVLVIAGAAILLSLSGENISPGGRYKDYSIYAGESAIVWPWEYQSIYEKYTSVEIDGIPYIGTGSKVSETLADKSIGDYTLVGYDETDNRKQYMKEFEVYTLKDIAQSQFVAVEMEGNYYIFKCDKYTPPATLGELMDAVNLSKAVELSRFSENGDSPDSNYFALTNDDYVWEILSGCRNASFVEDQEWTVSDRNYLSFTITSEVLGVYKVALYVTEDGYLWTNAFGWQYLFNIGEDVAGRIIKYAKENSVEAEYEPYRASVTGTITEITKEYILVDDSILCKNPADGITYKVLLNDLRISRYVDYGVIRVGDIVQISYNGEIDENNDNTIESAISAEEATISDGNVVIPE